MSTFRSPVGPQPPRVYWRRRLFLGLGVLAVIVVIIMIVSRPGPIAPGTTAGGTTPASGAPAAGSPSPAVSAQPSGAPCLPANVTVTAVTDKTTYATNEKPLISMTIVNTGKNACTINVGSTQQQLTITSGSEKIWDSKDCQTAPVDLPYTLQPAKPAPTETTAWDRTRSSTTTCSAAGVPVSASGASYHLAVKLGAIVSKETAQFILK